MEGKNGNYLKYAIGEIVLVIIGILIALQLNNANEKRKFNNQISEKIQDLVINLEEEIQVSGAFRAPNQISRLERFLDGSLTIDSLRIHPEYIDLSLIILKPDVMEESIEFLIDNEDRLPEKYKELIPKMKSLKFYFTTYLARVQEFEVLKRNNESILENNFSWFSLDDSISNEERLEYYTTDPYFKNRVSTISKKLQRAYFLYSNTIIRRLEMLCIIKIVEEHYTSEDFRSYLTSPTFTRNVSFFNEGRKLPCNSKPNLKTKVASHHLLVNKSTDTIGYYLPSGFFRKIPPGTVDQFGTSSGNDIIEIYRKNNCEAYQVTPTNFIIIE